MVEMDGVGGGDGVGATGDKFRPGDFVERLKALFCPEPAEQPEGHPLVITERFQRDPKEFRRCIYVEYADRMTDPLEQPSRQDSGAAGIVDEQVAGCQCG